MIAAATSGATYRGVPSTKMKPRASAPAATLARASSALVIPQIFTLTTPSPLEQELAHLGPDIGGPHEPLADQYGMSAGRDDALDVVARGDPALADGHRAGRHARQ